MAHRHGWNVPLFVRTFVRTIIVRTLGIAALVLSCPGVSFGQVRPYAFVPNVVDGTVTVLNADDHTVATTIPVDTVPRAVAVTPDGRRAYVVDYDDGNSITTLKAIDVATRTVVADMFIGFDTSTAIAITPNGLALYIVRGSDVRPVDVPTHAWGPLFAGPGDANRSIAIHPDGLRAYVTTIAGTYPLNLTSGVYGTVIPTGNSFGIAISPDGQTAYVAAATQMIVVDAGTQSVIGSPIAVGTSPSDVAFSPDGAFAYVANSGSNNVSVIDAATRTV